MKNREPLKKHKHFCLRVIELDHIRYWTLQPGSAQDITIIRFEFCLSLRFCGDIMKSMYKCGWWWLMMMASESKLKFRNSDSAVEYLNCIVLHIDFSLFPFSSQYKFVEEFYFVQDIPLLIKHFIGFHGFKCFPYDTMILFEHLPGFIYLRKTISELMIEVSRSSSN